MKHYLIVVDMQNDFIDGALGSQYAKQTVLPRVAEKLKQNQYDAVIFTRDTHEPDYLSSLEGKFIPINHCIVDTAGWQISTALQNIVPNCIVHNKETFGSRDLPELICGIANGESFDLELCGLCTDICVISNALLLRAFFPDVSITVDGSACGGSTADAHKAALSVMKNCAISVSEN